MAARELIKLIGLIIARSSTQLAALCWDRSIIEDRAGKVLKAGEQATKDMGCVWRWYRDTFGPRLTLIDLLQGYP